MDRTTLATSCKWDHTVLVPVRLANFTQHDVLKQSYTTFEWSALVLFFPYVLLFLVIFGPSFYRTQGFSGLHALCYSKNACNVNRLEWSLAFSRHSVDVNYYNH